MIVWAPRIAALLVVAQALHGCLDMSPAPYTAPPDRPPPAPPPALDAGGPGDATEGGVEPLAACRECLTGEDGPCAEDFAGCASTGICAELIDCAIDLTCIALPNLEDIVPCAAPCLALVDDVTTANPDILAAAPVYYCARDVAVCGDVCVLP